MPKFIITEGQGEKKSALIMLASARDSAAETGWRPPGVEHVKTKGNRRPSGSPGQERGYFFFAVRLLLLEPRADEEELLTERDVEAPELAEPLEWETRPPAEEE